MNVGQVLKYLKEIQAAGIETFPNGWEYDSWRGSYDELAMKPTDEPESVGVLIQRTEDAIGSVFTGYKGGEYVMYDVTDVHIDQHGEWTDGRQALQWVDSIFPDMLDDIAGIMVSSDTEGLIIEQVFKRYIEENAVK